MIMNIKKKLRAALLAVYKPYIVRKEKFIATRMWKQGVKECIEAYKETKGPRFYLWFDRNSFQFIPIVYECRRKGDAIAMKYLIRSRKVKVRKEMTVEDMKRECFYYTPSKWGAIGCDSDNKLRLRKYAEWINYYMTELSEPMKKVRAFKP